MLLRVTHLRHYTHVDHLEAQFALLRLSFGEGGTEIMKRAEE